MKNAVYLILMLCLINIVSAARVGIIVQLPDDSIIEDCILLDSEKTAYDAFKEFDSNKDELEINWNGINPAVYVGDVNGIGYNEYGDYKSWAFSTVEVGKNSFDIPPEKSPGYGYSYGDYVIEVSGKIIGLSYATLTFNNNPPFPIESIEPFPIYRSYDELCQEMFIVNVTKIYIDGKKQSDSKVRGGKITDVFPGSKVEFEIELENLYQHSTEIDIEDISIEATIEEIDDEDDIEEEISDFDLGADKRSTKEIEFEIPLEVEAKTRLVKIEIKAKDSAGIKYENEFTYALKVEKETHKLKILKTDLNKQQYACGENVILDFSIINIGSNDEDVDVVIESSDLQLNTNEDFELTNDVYEPSSRYEKKFNLEIPDVLEKKTYPVTITASYSSKEETKDIDLVINECEKEFVAETTQPKEEEPTETEKEEKITIAKITKEENLPITLIIALAVLFFVIIILAIFFFVKKK